MLNSSSVTRLASEVQYALKEDWMQQSPESKGRGIDSCPKCDIRMMKSDGEWLVNESVPLQECVIV